MKRIILAGACALALAACNTGGTGSGSGGTGAGGADAGAMGTLINVNVSDIRAEIAKNINVSVENVPITVQASVEVAADVCGLSVNLISIQIAAGTTTCTAKTTSAALEQVVRNQMA